MNPFAFFRRLRARHDALVVDLNAEADAVEVGNYELRAQIIAAEITQLTQERDRSAALTARFERMIARKRDELLLAQGRAERARALAMIDRADAIVAQEKAGRGPKADSTRGR